MTRPTHRVHATTVASANMDFSRDPLAHHADLRALAQVALIVCVQELRHHIAPWFGHGTTVVQPDRPGGEAGGEAVVVSSVLKVRRTGFRVAALRTFGNAIQRRHFPWAIVRIPGLGWTLVVSVHMPPARMQDGPLYPTYAAHLRRLIRWAQRLGLFWVVLGDWNRRHVTDPAALRHTFGARWFGDGIDLAAVDPRIVARAEKVGTRTLHDPTPGSPRRDSDHPVTLLDLEFAA